MRVMDSLTEAKLNKFESSVIEAARKRSAELEEDIKKEKEEKLEKSYNEFLTKAYRDIQRCVSRIRKEDNERVRYTELEAKKTLLKKREEIIDEVFAEAKNRLLEFKKSSEYASWLKKCTEKALSETGEGEKEIYVTEEDSALIEEKLFGVRITAVSDKDFWGGVRVKNSQKGIMADYSFYEFLQSERTDFLQSSGLVIA